jgi:hypothetical protein
LVMAMRMNEWMGRWSQHTRLTRLVSQGQLIR